MALTWARMGGRETPTAAVTKACPATSATGRFAASARCCSQNSPILAKMCSAYLLAVVVAKILELCVHALSNSGRAARS